MKKVLLSLFLLGIMPVCFGQSGEVNEREFICAKIGRIGSSTVNARLHGVPIEEVLARVERHFEMQVIGDIDDDQLRLEAALKKFAKEVYDNTEDNTPLAAYATQYTRCLTNEIFKGISVFWRE